MQRGHRLKIKIQADLNRPELRNLAFPGFELLGKEVCTGSVM